MSNDTLPPLPVIRDADLQLAVFTHRSLSRGDDANDQWGDTDRLAVLGEKVMEMAITTELFLEKPLLDKSQMETKRAAIIDVQNYDNWLTRYNLKRKLAYVPGTDPLETYEDKQKYFHTIVGALYYQQHFLGITGEEVSPWLSQLINPNNASSNASETESNYGGPGTPGTNPPSYASSSPGYQGSFGGQPGYVPPQSTQHFPHAPPPPASAPPPIPNAPPPPHPPGNGPAMHPPSSVSSLITVALINQTAAQRSLEIKWDPSPPVGPAHAPIWTVRCTINGVEYGRGTGKNTKIAKEEAAKQAWVNLGW